MRAFRNQLRKIVLGALPAAAMACSSGNGASTSNSGSGTGSGTTSSSGSTSGCSGTCGCSHDSTVLVAPFDGGFDDGGPLDPGFCHLPCLPDGGAGHMIQHCSAVPERDGGVDWELRCTIVELCTGRRPQGLCAPQVASRSLLGDHFARMAHLEAASVPAFRRMARELKAHGAPLTLIRAAHRSARDEVRHARVMSRFARAHGTAVPKVVHAEHQARSLEELTIENAVEGCVRETLGAAIALAQSRLAPDPKLRAALASIAEDELRHAELAHRVQAWALPLLSSLGRKRVATAQRRALREIDPCAIDEGTLSRAIGLPDRATVQRILAGLTTELALAG
jgi:hypothetical protein